MVMNNIPSRIGDSLDRPEFKAGIAMPRKSNVPENVKRALILKILPFDPDKGMTSGEVKQALGSGSDMDFEVATTLSDLYVKGLVDRRAPDGCVGRGWRYWQLRERFKRSNKPRASQSCATVLTGLDLDLAEHALRYMLNEKLSHCLIQLQTAFENQNADQLNRCLADMEACLSKARGKIAALSVTYGQPT